MKAINHIDGNGYNNDPANLEVVDVGEKTRIPSVTIEQASRRLTTIEEALHTETILWNHCLEQVTHHRQIIINLEVERAELRKVVAI